MLKPCEAAKKRDRVHFTRDSKLTRESQARATGKRLEYGISSPHDAKEKRGGRRQIPAKSGSGIIRLGYTTKSLQATRGYQGGKKRRKREGGEYRIS